MGVFHQRLQGFGPRGCGKLWWLASAICQVWRRSALEGRKRWVGGHVLSLASSQRVHGWLVEIGPHPSPLFRLRKEDGIFHSCTSSPVPAGCQGLIWGGRGGRLRGSMSLGREQVRRDESRPANS